MFARRDSVFKNITTTRKNGGDNFSMSFEMFRYIYQPTSAFTLAKTTSPTQYLRKHNVCGPERSNSVFNLARDLAYVALECTFLAFTVDSRVSGATQVGATSARVEMPERVVRITRCHDDVVVVRWARCFQVGLKVRERERGVREGGWQRVAETVVQQSGVRDLERRRGMQHERRRLQTRYVAPQFTQARASFEVRDQREGQHVRFRVVDVPQR